MELAPYVEALLVASDDPLPASELARILRARAAEWEGEQDENSGLDPSQGADEEEKAWFEQLLKVQDSDVIEALKHLNEAYEADKRSFRVLERAKGWKIYTLPEFGDYVRLLFPGQKPKRLSSPAMETLAVIAYRQPVTKAAIEAVRGVASDGMVQKLLDLELIKIGGRADLPGRPLLYETTDHFFEHFGIKSPDELPNARELRGMELPEGEETPEGETESENQPSLAEAPITSDETEPAVVTESETEEEPETEVQDNSEIEA